MPNDEDGELADGIRRHVYSLVADVATTTDSRAFAALLKPLTEAARTIAEDGDAVTLWKLVSVLGEIAAESPATPGTRAAVAATFVRTMSSPILLAPIADLALTPALDRDRCARRIIVRAGARGAHALYSARVCTEDPEARSVFTAILREIGAPGAPVVRSALQGLDAKRSLTLVCDLLEGLSASRNDAACKIIAKYTRSSDPQLARAARAAFERSTCRGDRRARVA